MRRLLLLAAGLISSFHFVLSTAEPPSIRFIDIAAQAGIRAEMVCGGPEKKWIPEANGSGVAALDYDNDGLLDILIVNGSTMDRLARIVERTTPPAPKGAIYLFHNLGNGRFEDVTSRAGLFNPYWGTGANAADFNNDGYVDILITNIGVDLLFRNNGDGTFTEIGKSAGLTRSIHWHTGSAFGDYDNDGKLDLYIAGYVDIHSLNLAAAPPVCNYRGLPGFCGPLNLKGEPDILYHNDGNGVFSDVTARAKVVDAGARYGFAVVFEDFNQDGKPDIFVANDSGANYLYLNKGDGTFEESALTSGLAFNADGKSQANMGVAVGDYDNDGNLDLLTTTFSEDYFPLFKQISRGFFEDVSARAGLAAVTVPYLGWACGFADFDNDGERDLWVANGHVYPNAGNLGSTTYLQPFTVFRNRRGHFSEASLGLPKNSYRGACAGDFDNDGRIDVVVLPVSGAPMLLSNRTAAGNHWIGFSLQGNRGNRDGLGAQVRIEACGYRQFDTVRNGGSYLSRNDPRIHFGLGLCDAVDQASIVWPSGRRQTLKNPAINRYIKVREP
jgi:enediyne biosynthesis protein E4